MTTKGEDLLDMVAQLLARLEVAPREIELIAPGLYEALGDRLSAAERVHEAGPPDIKMLTPQERLTLSERLLYDLYLNLRRSVNWWSEITKQTAQARMGYVGQHLVSLVTGYPGGRSGARGHDLIISENEHGEVKTCYRVDQLGKCNNCGQPVAANERACAYCDSVDITRKDDSKWLITIRNDDEVDRIMSPTTYYFVLFEFKDISHPDEIVASIWSVDTDSPGFVLGCVDYYFNIKAKSKSGAPLNLWPYAPKFYMMRPVLIYRAEITNQDEVRTLRFLGCDSPFHEPMPKLTTLSRKTTFGINEFAVLERLLDLSASSADTKKTRAVRIEKHIEENNIDRTSTLPDLLAFAVYGPAVFEHREKLGALWGNLPVAEMRRAAEALLELNKGR